MTESPNRADALTKLCPGAKWVVQDIGGPNETVDWEDTDQLEPSKEEVDKMLGELQKEFSAQEYARNRQAEYPSVGDQLDMLMKDMRDGTTTHQESCEAVKDKYPKPT